MYSWGIACRRCSNYIFIIDLASGLIQWIGQRQLQDETKNILVLRFSASYTRSLTQINSYTAIPGNYTDPS